MFLALLSISLPLKLGQIKANDWPATEPILDTNQSTITTIQGSRRVLQQRKHAQGTAANVLYKGPRS